MYDIEGIKKITAPIAKNHHIKIVWLFGSNDRGEQTEQSDIDFHIDRGDVCSGLILGAFFADLENAFNKKIDVVTTQSLSEELLEHIRKDEVLIYSE